MYYEIIKIAANRPNRNRFLIKYTGNQKSFIINSEKLYHSLLGNYLT